MGGTTQVIKSYKYDVLIKAQDGKLVDFIMYGIDKKSTQLRNVDLAEVLKLFPNVKSEQLRRPAGEISSHTKAIE